jgi:mannosylglycerate hydrolase
MKKYHITVVSHTHWDRAWYVTFQEFRARLVRLVDRLLKILENQPEFRLFMLDGQMAVLEDYLEVRPQRQAELERFCRQGRLKVGPWYVLSDEFLVSPEALIRNLMIGQRMGEAYGGVGRLGYVPDGFGHIAQLPQILCGFGIDNAFFWRGLGEEGERLGTEFSWKALDGSAVTTIWMPWGYHNISNLGYGIHWGDTSQMAFDPELALAQIQKAVDDLIPMAHTDAILLMNGIDHEEAEPRLPEMIQQANQSLDIGTFEQGSLEDHLDRIRQQNPSLPEYSGEFRWGKYSEILQGVYATRIYLKQANQRIENLLERYTEPLAAMAWLSGGQVADGTQDLLWTAWRWLLRNHPHDDIYGSGIDLVHEEMMYRFSQAEQIGEIVVRDSFRQLARQIDFTGQEGMPVLVYNPLGWARYEMAIGNLDFDFDDPTANHFRVVNNQGQPVPHQVLGDETLFWMETLKANRKRRIKVAFQADVPACGYATYFVQPARDVVIQVKDEDWKIETDGAENRYMAFKIEADGSITIRDKTSGTTYAGLHHFEDVEDAGDEYSYSPCRFSKVISTVGKPAAIRLVVSGPNLATFEVRRNLVVPESLADDRQHRSKKKVTLPIHSKITLYRGQPGLYLETEVDNLAKDHQLSAVFPASLNPRQVFVDESFAVLPRPIDLPAAEGWIEDPTPLMHQRAFIDLSEDGHGLAILNRGLPAVEVRRKEGGTQINLILLRCVGWLSRDDLVTRRVAAGPLAPAPGAQCPGKFRFEYAILPHSGDWKQVYPTAYGYISPMLAQRADTHEGLKLREMNITRDDPGKIKPIPWPRGGILPDRFSFIAADNQGLMLSSIHRGEGGLGLIARFYNLSSEAIRGRFTMDLSLAEAWLTNMNEEPQEKLLLLDEHTFDVSFRGQQVITCELRLKPLEAETARE